MLMKRDVARVIGTRKLRSCHQGDTDLERRSKVEEGAVANTGSAPLFADGARPVNRAAYH
jgi:hypothetical protein